jgi:hypothetical protein
MGSGVLAYKTEKEPLKRLFFARHFPCPTIGRSSREFRALHPSGGFSFGRLGWRGLNTLIFFVASPFDFVDGGIVAGEPI